MQWLLRRVPFLCCIDRAAECGPSHARASQQACAQHLSLSIYRHVCPHLHLFCRCAGAGPAIAEANALLKGPVVFHIDQRVIARVRQQAARGHHDFQQLELDLFRVAGKPELEALSGFVGGLGAGIGVRHGCPGVI